MVNIICSSFNIYIYIILFSLNISIFRRMFVKIPTQNELSENTYYEIGNCHRGIDFRIRYTRASSRKLQLKPHPSQDLLGTFALESDQILDFLIFLVLLFLYLLLLIIHHNCYHMREVGSVRYTPRAWDPRSLQSILDGPFYFVSNEPYSPEAFISISRKNNNDNITPKQRQKL